MLIPAASGVLIDGCGAVLCVRRAHPPAAGRWSLPGGRVDAGETPAAAVVRELAEETGLQVSVGRALGRVRVPATAPGDAFEIHVFAVVARGGHQRPGDDASAVAWLDRAQLDALPITPGLAETLAGFGAFTPRGLAEALAWAGVPGVGPAPGVR